MFTSFRINLQGTVSFIGFFFSESFQLEFAAEDKCVFV